MKTLLAMVLMTGTAWAQVPNQASTSIANLTSNISYVSSFPASCTVSGTPYTTQLDCAFYSTIASGGSDLVLGAGTYTTAAGLVEPTLGTQVSLVGQVEGFNGLPTQIQATSSMQAMLSHPDILTSQSSPYNLRVENIAFNGNGLASQCIALYAEKLSVRRNLTCRNAVSTSLAHIQFGDPSPPGGYQSAGYQDFTEHVYDFGTGNGNSSWASITVSQSGGVPSIAVSSGGTYVNSSPPVYFWGFQQSAAKAGSSATAPCTTMGTSTATMSGSSVSSVTMTGYSGCSGLLYAYIPDIGPANYGFEEAETDSHFFDIEVQNAGRIAGIHYSSGSDFIGGDHAYGGMPVNFKISNPQKAIVGLEPDTANIFAIEDDSGKNIYTSTEFVTPQFGAVGFYAAGGSIGILGSTCGSGSITANNFTLMVTSSGAVGHGSAVYPAEVIDAVQCDDLSKVDYIPALSASSINITGGGNIATSSGTTNAVAFFLSSGIQIQSSNATNTALTVQNNNASPTADLLDLKSGTGLTLLASVDNLGNGHFPAVAATGTISSASILAATIYSAAGTSLPSCVTGIKGERAVVSDATSPTFLAAYTSGGTVVAPVICNGTAWVTY